jgi:hypothetical protein
MSEESEKVEIDWLDAMVDMATGSLPISRGSTLPVSDVWLVQPQG